MRIYSASLDQWMLWQPVLVVQLNWVLVMGLDIRYAIAFLCLPSKAPTGTSMDPTNGSLAWSTECRPR